MAVVKLINGWFAPSEKFLPDKLRIFSGKFYRRGETEVPDELIEFLPKYAEVLDKKPAEKKVAQPQETLRDYDIERANSDALVNTLEKAEKSKK